MLSLQEIKSNPDFQKLAPTEQKKVLSRVFPTFDDLPEIEKSEVLKADLGIMSNHPEGPETTKEKILKEIPRVGGGIVGGLLAAPSLNPFVIAGGVGAGAAAGEAYRQLGQRDGEPSKAPKTSLEAAKEIAKIGGREAVFDLGGQFILRGAGKILTPFAKKMSAEAKQTIQLLKDKIKPALTPAEATESRVLDVLENISEGSLLGGGKISEFKIKRQNVLNDMADDIIDVFGKKVEPDEVGEVFVNFINDEIDVFKSAAGALYNNVEELTKGSLKRVPTTTQVDTGLLDAAGKPILKTVTKYVEKVVGGAKIPIGTVKTFAKPLSTLGKDISNIESKNAGDDLVEALLSLPDTIDFAAAKELRSRLLSRIDEFKVINKKAPAIGKAKKIIELLDSSIGLGLKRHGLKALTAWRAANNFYKTQSKKFNSTLIRRLIKKGDPALGGDPESIAKAVFKPGGISVIKKVKTTVDKKTWQQLQSYYIQRLFAQSAAKDGTVKGVNLLGNMFGKAGMGKQSLREIFNPQQLNDITNFANALKLAQSKQTEGLGKMWIQLTQAGAIASLVGGYARPAAATIVFGPVALSRIMLNPHMVKLLTSGYKLPAKSPKLAGLAARLAAGSKRIENEHEKYLKE